MDFETLKNQVMGLYDEQHDVHEKMIRLWVSDILLTWRWWISLALIILPWIIWLFVHKKESTDRLLYAGMFVMLVASYIDMVGVTLNLWSYPVEAIPLMPSYLPFDVSSLPVTTILLIQFFPKVKPIYKAIIYAVFGSLIFQPLMTWLGLYEPEGWKHRYSLLPLFILYLAANYIANRKKFDLI